MVLSLPFYEISVDFIIYIYICRLCHLNCILKVIIIIIISVLMNQLQEFFVILSNTIYYYYDSQTHPVSLLFKNGRYRWLSTFPRRLEHPGSQKVTELSVPGWRMSYPPLLLLSNGGTNARTLNPNVTLVQRPTRS